MVRDPRSFTWLLVGSISLLCMNTLWVEDSNQTTILANSFLSPNLPRRLRRASMP